MKKIHRFWVVLLAVAIVMAAGATQAATITGVIKANNDLYDPDIPNPVPGRTFAVVYQGETACTASYLTYGGIDATGKFEIKGLPPTLDKYTRYFVKTWSDQTKEEYFVDAWFNGNGINGYYDCASVTTPIVLGASETKDVGTIKLQLGDWFSGTVTNHGNSGSTVNTYVLVLQQQLKDGVPTNGCTSPIFSISPTDSSGKYETDNLPIGNYFLQTYSFKNYLSAWIGFLGTTTNCSDALAIFANNAGNKISGKDFTLSSTGGTISGTIILADGSGTMDKILVNIYAFDASLPGTCKVGRWVTTAFPNTDTTSSEYGKYTTPTLAPGSYYIQSYSTDGTYENEYYPATVGGSTTACTGATKIDLNAGDMLTGYNLPLYSVTNSTISGFVYKTGTTTPISGIYVNVYESTTTAPYYGKWVTSAVVQSNGSYKTPYIPKGKYKLQTYDPTFTYLNQWYSGTDPSVYYASSAAVVDTTTTQENINFYLNP
uniref:Carboxypeptidase regulatory-like domain-containing protein n=1 Tax=Desulfatirhabdium butyrativorans TaxID=340467 RepID=A0A7C4RSD5_9BACT